MYGNFDNQDFIILEPLIEQLDKNEFKNFAGQDTFIKGNVYLSDKTIIIIKKETYEKFKKENPEIDSFNIVLYNGIPKEYKEEYLKDNDNSTAIFDINDQRAIVERVLIDLGYVPELIGSHYIIDSPTSNKIREVNIKLGKKYNTNAETKHNYTEEYQDDFNKNIEISQIFDRQLLDFFINKYNLTNIDKTPNRWTAGQIIEILNTEEIFTAIDEFNLTIEKMKDENLLPTSIDVLNNINLNIYEYYINNFIKKI